MPRHRAFFFYVPLISSCSFFFRFFSSYLFMKNLILTVFFLLNFVLLQHLFDFLRVSLDFLTNYDTLALTSKDFFSSLRAKRLLLSACLSALKVLRNPTKIDPRADFRKREHRRPTMTSFPRSCPFLLSRFFHFQCRKNSAK